MSRATYNGSHMTGTAIDTSARPDWQRTGYTYFPYAAQRSGQWWVLRLNLGFPAHDLCTLFIDGIAAADITGGADHPLPLAASVGALKWSDSADGEPHLDADTATAVVQAVAAYANYGSEHGDPCLLCSEDVDPMTRG